MLFSEVKFSIVNPIQDEIRTLLHSHGGQEIPVLCQSSTLVVVPVGQSTDVVNEIEYLFRVPVVTTTWVTTSLTVNRLLPYAAFHPSITTIFEGLTICFTSLNLKDSRLLAAHVQIRGGRISSNILTQATHVVAGRPEGKTFYFANSCPHLVVVGVDWLVESIRANALQPIEQFRASDFRRSRKICSSKKRHCNQIQCNLLFPVQSTEIENQSEPKRKRARPSDSSNSTSSMIQPEQEKIDRLLLSSMYHPRPTPLDVSLKLFKGEPIASEAAQSPMPLAENVSNIATETRLPESSVASSPKSLSKPTKEIVFEEVSHNNSTLIVEPPPAGIILKKEDFSSSFLGCVLVLVFHYNTRQPFFPPDLNDERHRKTGELNVTSERCRTWSNNILVHGGELVAYEEVRRCLDEGACGDQSEPWSRVTHVVFTRSALQDVELYWRALICGKRVVAIYWADHVVSNCRFEPPTNLMHVPCALSPRLPHEAVRRLVVSTTGFKGDLRGEIIFFLQQLGVKFTSNFSYENTLLLCESLTGPKVDLAQKLGIPCVNLRWLHDLFLGDLTPVTSLARGPAVLPQYSIFTPLNSDSVPLFNDCDRVEQMLAAWQEPIRVRKRAWKVFAKRLAAVRPPDKWTIFNTSQHALLSPLRLHAVKEFPFRPLSGNERLLALRGPLSKVPRGEVTVACSMSRGEPDSILERQIRCISEAVTRLGGRFITSGPPAEVDEQRWCTHLVLLSSEMESQENCPTKFVRTRRLFHAVMRGIFVVRPQWVAGCELRGDWLDELMWVLQDARLLWKFGVDLLDAWHKAKKMHDSGLAGVFAGLRVCVSPGAMHAALCRELLRLGGGELVEQPGPGVLLVCHENEAPTFWANGVDPKLCHHEEFILSGALRQTVDYESYQIQYVCQQLYHALTSNKDKEITSFNLGVNSENCS